VLNALLQQQLLIARSVVRSIAFSIVTVAATMMDERVCASHTLLLSIAGHRLIIVAVCIEGRRRRGRAQQVSER
jgi:hypothetical protein